MVFYPNPINCGLKSTSSLGDGYTVNIQWHQAYASTTTNRIAYNIYYSEEKETVFSDGIKFVSVDDSLEANIINLTPGQLYFFSVRPVEYDPILYNLDAMLPVAYDNLRIIPSSLLRSDIYQNSLTVPLLDVSEFPNTGVVKAGTELIRYSSVNYITNNLAVPGSVINNAYFIDQGGEDYSRSPGNDGYLIGLTLINLQATAETWIIRCVGIMPDGYAKFSATGSISGTSRDGYTNPIIWTSDSQTNSNGVFEFSILQASPFVIGDYFTIKIGAGSVVDGGRGYNNTNIRSHTTDGYDGYYYWDPAINFFVIGEENSFDRIFMCQNRFEYPNFQRTNADGYHQVTKDLLTSDLSESDNYNVDFPAYDYAGYHRTDPVQLLNGTCVGSYIGGEMGCIDKFGNVHMLRGFSLQDHNNQRQELGLSVTGKPAVLIKRVRTGITCACYQPSSEYPDDRCPLCYGTKFVFGYEQYFNPRRSDGRIMVRPSPADEDVKMTEAGLESEMLIDFWTLTVPTIKDRDILVLFDMAGNEEYRYEVLSVTRNNTVLELQGGQKIKAQRIRKTDPAYQVRIFRDSSMFPSQLNTSIGFTTSIVPHTHKIVISEKIVSINQINQTTEVSQGHNHVVKDGIIMPAVGHSHTIIMP
jgi:hypothetical protein